MGDRSAAFIAALLFVAMSNVDSRAIPAPLLPYEAHSFPNELGMWPQLLRHEVGWFKMDASVCTRDACGNFSTWSHVPGRGNASECIDGGSGSVYCCICLRGDASLRPNLIEPFNTSHDLIALLADQELRSLLPPAGARPLMLGIDWGGPTPAGGVVSPLIADFLLGLRDAIEGANVLPYFDSEINGWMTELDRACAGAGGCTPAQAALSALAWPNEGAPPLPPASEDPHPRYAIFNDDYSGLNATCRSGKWGNVTTGRAPPSFGGSFPILEYEQAAQSEFQSLLHDWAICDALPEWMRPPSSGWLVAVSNIGPEQMEVFAAYNDRLGRGLDEPANGQGTPSTGSHPQLVVLACASNGTQDHWAVILATPSGGAAPAISVHGFEDGVAPGGTGGRASTPLAVPNGWMGRVVSFGAWEGAAEASPILYAATSDGLLFAYSFAPVDGTILPLAGGPYISLPLSQGTSVVAATVVCAPGAPSASAACVAVVATTNGTRLDVVVSRAIGGAGGVPAVLTSAVVEAAFAITGGASLALLPIDSQSGALSFAGIALYSAGVASRPILYGALVELNVTDDASLASLTITQAGGPSTPSRLGFGSHPHVATRAFRDVSNGNALELLLLATHTDGSCEVSSNGLWRHSLQKPSNS